MTSRRLPSLITLGVLCIAVAAYAQAGDRAAGVSAKQLRSHDQLVESYVLRPAGVTPNELLSMVREHWSVVRSKNLAAATPILILIDNPPNGQPSIQYSFRWRDPRSREKAEADAEIKALTNRIRAKSVTMFASTRSNQAYQGFDYAKFPDTGGVELLAGRCDSEVHLKGVPTPVRLSVRNGFVLMHRSPGLNGQRSDREMFVQIMQHGGDVDVNEGAVGPNGDLRVLRVEQNVERPQYGLIRANSTQRDFPATAMWVVHWRIITTMGTLITDPDTPLVFGPTQVQHYPPVGTEFFSNTGPVNLIVEKTGEVVGTLTPKELTAFDIVVTKDDEIPSILLNKPPAELEQLFATQVARASTAAAERTQSPKK